MWNLRPALRLNPERRKQRVEAEQALQ